ncbi:hypothetical protein V6N11_079437 [Hibiscus sabdariffa]|uniref:Reverse transcriptase zinc-binding domain-containing protein n=1 Tax=Hibiscus sabdariffa TaxID=183260 RepID=A0ABR2RVE4_9ROSI
MVDTEGGWAWAKFQEVLLLAIAAVKPPSVIAADDRVLMFDAYLCNPCCGVCGASEENLSHLFRDCVEARMLWARVVKEERLAEFLSLDFQTWLAVNIRNQHQLSINTED